MAQILSFGDLQTLRREGEYFFGPTVSKVFITPTISIPQRKQTQF